MIDWTKEQVRKTATQMVADNPLLTDGQLAVESDTRRGKVGPGYFNALGYDASIDVAKADAAWETDQRDDATAPGLYEWEGYLTQADTDPPTVVELKNTLGGSPVLGYLAPGAYTATLAGAFGVTRTSTFLGPVSVNSSILSGQVVEVSAVDDDSIGISSGVVGATEGLDGILAGTYFYIRVKRP